MKGKKQYYTAIIIVVLLSLLSLHADAETCRDKTPLPQNLDNFPLYALSGELHLHGDFRIDLNKSHEISFTVSQPSFFRAYMSPHTVDIDLYLKQGSTVVDLSITAYREELIAKPLEGGNYVLELRPLSSLNTEEEQSVLLEIAIAPQDVTMDRIHNYNDCPSGQLLPSTLDFSPLEIGEPFYYTTENKPNSRRFNILTQPSNDTWKSTYVAAYNFTLDPKPGTNPVYRFSATLGYDFLTGGSVRIVVAPTQPDGSEPPCYFFFSQCVFGKNIVSNKHSLITTLGPGNYSLWFVDNVGKKFPNITSCTPVTLEISIEQDMRDESFVSCHAERIPTDLNSPGFIDATGFLHFRENVLLDLADRNHKTEFILQAPSKFRIFTEPHRIDIDLELRNSTSLIARTIQMANQDESLSVELFPNVQYTIIYHYYTSLETKFCETFLLEIGIEPTVNTYDYCENKQTTVPDVDLHDYNGYVYNLQKTEYYHVFTTPHHNEDIIRIPIYLHDSKKLNAVLGSSFFNGLQLSLISNSTMDAKPIFNGFVLQTILEPRTNYTLVISAGSSQTNKLPLPNFPKCAFYEFELQLTWPFVAPITESCTAIDFPNSLYGPKYLGSSDRVHFRDQYLLPSSRGLFDAETYTRFSVRKRSIFRAYTELDEAYKGFFITFNITGNDGVTIPHVVSEKYGEQITAILQPNVEYRLDVGFNGDFSQMPVCQDWNLELEIAPLEQYTDANCAEALPPATIWMYNDNFTLSEEYAFLQSSKPFSHNITFKVEGFAYIRAQIYYDFVWNDLSLRLWNNDTLVALGINEYNKNEIEGAQLSKGTYVLEIWETESQENEELRQCADFKLEIGITPLTLDSELKAGTIVCKDLMFPTTFDSISYLSEISGNMMHFANKVLVNTQSRKQNTNFHVKETSYFRIFVPPFIVDIDIMVYLLDESGDVEKELAVSNGYEEESILLVLEPGYYRLTLQYFPHFRRGYFFPTKEDCASYRLEVSLSPVAYANEHQIKKNSCVRPSLPLTIHTNESFVQIYNRPFTNDTYSIPFSITTPSFITAVVNYPFPLGGLAMSLTGSKIVSPYRSAPANRTYSANIAQGIASLEEILYPGDYVLNIMDLENYTSIATLSDKCSSFAFSYLIDENVPSDCCDDADKLPTDLFSSRGGSKPYGGPQNPDGSVRISGKHFLMPSRYSHNNLMFNVHNTSWVRFWAKSKGDVDFILWKNASKTDIIEVAVGLDSVESHITLLQPQDEPYLLDLYVFDRSEDKCTYLEFEFALELNSTVYSERICPSPLPNPVLPPKTITLSEGVVDIFSMDFLFTSDFVKNNSVNLWTYSVVTYEMNLIVPHETYSVMIYLGYDFTLTDFGLSLWNGSKLLHASHQGSTPWENTYVDFQDTIVADLTPGNYTLKIIEKVYRSRGEVSPGECDKFAFMLMAQAKGDNNTAPYIASVVPPSGTDMDATYPLYIYVTFSVAIHESVPRGYLDLKNFLKDNNVVYIVNRKNNQEKEFPASAFIHNNKSLTLIFMDINFDTTYDLVLNAENVPSSAGVNFTKHTERHSYSTLDCKCGGNGYCSENATHIRDCECYYPFAGPGCKSCVLGYHREAATCLPNTFCSENTCNGHGECDDHLGYPQCACDEGFEDGPDGFCTQCHVGYAGPNCTAINQNSVRCTNPYLPLDLNTVAYLGTTGKVHIQNNYVIDLDHTSHEMAFVLNKESYFRIYVEPHQVDIDLWLYKVTGNSTNRWQNRVLIKNSIAFYEEESMFLYLETGSYVMSFQILPYSRQVSIGPCPTFNMELAIEPKDSYEAEIQRYTPDCTITKLPRVPIRTGDQAIVTDFIYNPNDLFVLRANSNNQSGEIYSFQFQVKPPKDKIALLHTELTYRFLAGDLALKLQRADENTTAVVGYNDFNKHYLQYYLFEGIYNVSIYLPEPQSPTVNPCIPFLFTFTVTFEGETKDVFNCDNPRIPKSLNVPAYEGDHIHIFDDFLMEDNSHSSEFTVNSKSNLRVSARTSANTPVSISLEVYDSVTKNYVRNVTSEPGIQEIVSSNLVAGEKYRLVYMFGYFEQSGFTCPTVEIELEIQPNLAFVEDQEKVVCPIGGISRLPRVPATIFTLPYHYHEPYNASNIPEEEIFYHSNQIGIRNVTQLTFTISDTVQFDAGIGVHFLSGNLRLELTVPRGDVIKSVSSQENFNYISQQLEPGTYTLSIINNQRFSRNLIPCIPFTFDMDIVPISKTPDPCKELNLSPLPITLNMMRYLSLDGEITLQRNNWAAPTISSFYTTHNISFTVAEPSLIRVYVERNEIDIDIHLFPATSSKMIASGSNLFGEESFVAYIESGSYNIRLDFYDLRFQHPICPSFSMQIAVAPMNLLPTRELFCPENMKARFPTVRENIPESILPYHYDGNDEKFYFQQVDHNDFEVPIKSYNITFDSTVDIHVEIGYNFIVGDLVLKLRDLTSSETTYGKNEISRNVINKKGLTPGKYELTIYEASGNQPQTIGCSSFSFSILVDKNEPEVRRAFGINPDLPSDLNGVAYLRYSDEVHIQNDYVVLENTASNRNNSIHFHLKKESLVRTTVGVQVPLKLNFDNDDTTYHPSTYKKLAAGDHKINFILQDDRVVESIVSDVELVILPVTEINERVKDLSCNAETARWIPPEIVVRPTDGYYSYHEKNAYLTSEQLKVSGDLYNIPFELTMESEINFALQYDFSLTDLSIVIRDKNVMLFAPYRYGNNHYNIEDINLRLTPGRYELIIRQASAWNSQEIGTDLKCVEFDLRLYITQGVLPPCDSSATFPWDLNTNNGGSEPYGGPIKNGVLNMWHDTFLLNSNSDKLSTKFHISTPSALSIFISENSWTSLSFTISKNNSNTIEKVDSVSTHSNYFQRAAIFRLVTEGDYLLQFQYRPNRFEACPTFSFGLSIEPLTTLSTVLQEACTATTHELPPTKLTAQSPVDINSYFTQEDIQTYTNTETNFFVYKVDVTVSKDSLLNVALSYNSLSNFFTMRLKKKIASSYLDITFGTWSALASESSTLKFTQTINTPPLPEGEYQLWIEQPAIQDFAPDVTKCYPYQLSMYLQGKPNGPFITYVDPPTSSGFDPRKNLYIELRFSEQPFDKDQRPIARHQNTSPLLNAIILRNSTTTLHPDEALVPSTNPYPDDRRRWEFVFGGNKFDYGVTYELQLGEIYNSAGEKFTIQNAPRYTMKQIPKDCNHRGVFNEATKRCDCYPDSHSHGDLCEKCDAGYAEDVTGMCIVSGCSNVEPCGCLPREKETDTCIPRGTCVEDSSNPSEYKCECRNEYSGNHCEKCAPGRTNYPNCTLEEGCNPPCARGVCNITTHVCICPENYQGPTCEQCKDGFSGENCSPSSINGTWKIVGGISAVVATIVIIGMLVWWFRFRKGPSYDEVGLDMELEGGTRLATTGNGHVKLEDSDDEKLEAKNSANFGAQDSEDDSL